MKLHRKVATLLAAPLALFLWGCSGDDVESGADATVRGLDKAGNAIGFRRQVGG